MHTVVRGFGRHLSRATASSNHSRSPTVPAATASRGTSGSMPEAHRRQQSHIHHAKMVTAARARARLEKTTWTAASAAHRRAPPSSSRSEVRLPLVRAAAASSSDAAAPQSSGSQTPPSCMLCRAAPKPITIVSALASILLHARVDAGRASHGLVQAKKRPASQRDAPLAARRRRETLRRCGRW